MHYDLHTEMTTDDLWFCFHGATDHRRFASDCRMHEHATTCYPVAPKRWGMFRWGWLKPYTAAVVEMVGEVVEKLGREVKLVLAFHSYATNNGHRYARAILAADHDVRCVVHYAGLWKRANNLPAMCPGLGVVNIQDFGVLHDSTLAMANAYRAEMLRLNSADTRHRWANEWNAHIRERALAA